MNKEQFDALVKRLEGYARSHPAGYKLRVGLLAALGYGYIFLVLAALVALIVFLVTAATVNFLALKFAWILLVFAWVILRSLWVKLPAPQGLELRREDAPLLFEMVEEASARLESPRPEHILLTDDFNAAVVQVPRLGLFGWQVNYLVVGLPLMQALAPEQFRAVVAHELGHLSGNHGRFAGWIYRVRQTWVQLLLRLQKEHRRADIFEVFLKWYAPYFNAYSFVLGRAQEYEADLRAAELAGRDNAALALINLEVKARFLDQRFWRELLKDADRQAEPPAAAFAQMAGALRNGVAPEDARLWAAQALGVETGHEDTHPALRQRLAALGYLSDSKRDEDKLSADALMAAVATSAAEHFLGDSAEALTARLGLAWQEKAARLWRERHAFVRESQRKLQNLKKKAEVQTLTPEETLNYAVLVAELKGAEVAIPLFRKILASRPDDARANFVLGQMLLERMDEEGVACVEKAMEREPEAVIPGCELIHNFLIASGRPQDAEHYRARAEQHYRLFEMARAERRGVSQKDELLAHELPAAEVEKLREQLSRYPDLKAAYLARKAVAHLAAEYPCYVLGVVRATAWVEVSSAAKDAALLKQLAGGLVTRYETHIVILNKRFKWLKKRFSRLGGAEVYHRRG
jgi:Zn-dependent protease with chaperone function